MSRKLIIDGNAVYEIDEDCMLKNRIRENDYMREKEDKEHKNKRKSGQESTAAHNSTR